ncbi:MAG: class II fructose-bisphosphate aldolase [Oscillospiraceae bacterium]|nr:class II fructose-bisphosphate aldolase [Oscillospiraceae bacterium]
MLVSPRVILAPAFRQGRLVGAFNTGNLEMTMGILRAAEERKAPVLLQIAEKRLPHSPLALMGPMMVNAARQATVPVAVQLDHGEEPAVLAEAAALGFTGLMFDGSALSPDENARRTSAVRALGVDWIEGEIGVLAGSEGGPEAEALYSDPGQAQTYAEASGCDCLAVSIGNAHGHYKGKPRLNFTILEEIHRRLPDLPLVLHGGTGIPKEDLARAVKLGICKVNIATASFDALYKGASKPAGDYFSLSEAMAQSVYESTMKQLEWFGEVSA